ncbi:hypothetical protein Dsin_012817 [Dipteronia sinensis]|uniref:Zinc finger PMZ-type domain-containing protein n=1 Tax=Dipteronia sinensis TaxID=43782 RepID=A0AAE0AK39_9ROSI|nr:hypothetical protein Dsin_012817 [Dipteronia sinensis]
MKRMHKRRTECTRWSTDLPPVVHRTLEKLKQEGRSMQVLFANDFEFEILDEFGKKWVVDFRYHTYGCGAWQLSGLQCKHDMASLSHKRYHDGSSEPVQFVHALLKKEAYTLTYQPVIHPILDQRTWLAIPNHKIVPSIVKTKLG